MVVRLFPSSKLKVVGNTTMDLQKFDNGWKIVGFTYQQF
jgi:hypothetical protein